MKDKVKDTLQDITDLTSDYCNRNTLNEVILLMVR
jgi:hypothetical protein